MDHDADLIARLRKVIEGQGLSMAAMGKEICERDAEIARLRSAIHALCPSVGLGTGLICKDGMLRDGDGNALGSCEWHGHADGGFT